MGKGEDSSLSRADYGAEMSGDFGSLGLEVTKNLALKKSNIAMLA